MVNQTLKITHFWDLVKNNEIMKTAFEKREEMLFTSRMKQKTKGWVTIKGKLRWTYRLRYKRAEYLTEKCWNCNEMFGYIPNESTNCCLIDLHKFWTEKQLIKKGVCKYWEKKQSTIKELCEHTRLIVAAMKWYYDWFHYSYPSSKTTLYYSKKNHDMIMPVADFRPEESTSDCTIIKDWLVKKGVSVEYFSNKGLSQITIRNKNGKTFKGVHKSEPKAFLYAVVSYLFYNKQGWYQG